jgi:hypothetical protein
MAKSIEIIAEMLSPKTSCVLGLLIFGTQRCQFCVEKYTGSPLWSLTILDRQKQWLEILDFPEYGKDDYDNRAIINYLIANLERLIVKSISQERIPTP